MPMCPSVKMLYIHVPRTGGSTFRHLLNEAGIKQEYVDKKHLAAKTFRKILGSVDWHAYYKIGFIRNPYDRLVSRYIHRYHDDHNKKAAKYKTFEEWIKRVPDKKLRKLSQYEQLQACGSVDMNYFVHYENYVSDMMNLVVKYDLHEKLPHCNPSTRDVGHHYYNRYAKDRVYDILMEDFIEFGYKR